MIDSSRKMSYSLDKDNMFRRLNNDTFKTSVKINHKEVKKIPVINYAAKSNCDIMVTNFTLAEGETEPLKSGGPAKFTFQIANYTSVDPHLHLAIYKLNGASSFSKNPVGYCHSNHYTPCENVDSQFNGFWYSGNRSCNLKFFDPIYYIVLIIIFN